MTAIIYLVRWLIGLCGAGFAAYLGYLYFVLNKPIVPYTTAPNDVRVLVDLAIPAVIFIVAIILASTLGGGTLRDERRQRDRARVQEVLARLPPDERQAISRLIPADFSRSDLCAVATIASDPSGAHVYDASGRYLGDTSDEPVWLFIRQPAVDPPRASSVVLKKAGYIDTEQRFPVSWLALDEAVARPETVLVVLGRPTLDV